MTVTLEPRRPRWKSRAMNVSLSAGVLLVSLAFGEAILRAVVRRPLERQLPEVRYSHHEVRRFTLLPNQAVFTYGAPAAIGPAGFRTNGAAAGDADRAGLTIFALGDSFTFGLGVADRQTWPAQLEELLRRSTRKSVNVVNGGTISYGVFQELDLLREKGLNTRPKVVIHSLYWNDFMNPQPPPPGALRVVTADGYLAWDRSAQERSKARHFLAKAVSRSALLFTMLEAAGQVMERRGTTSYAQAYDRFLENGLTAEEWTPVENFYRDLGALGTQHGFTTAAVIMPVNDIVSRRSAASHPYATEARKRLSALGIPYVDGFTLWESHRLGARHFLPQGPDSHLDAEGYRLITRALGARLMADTQVSAFLRAAPDLP